MDTFLAVIFLGAFPGDASLFPFWFQKYDAPEMIIIHDWEDPLRKNNFNAWNEVGMGEIESEVCRRNDEKPTLSHHNPSETDVNFENNDVNTYQHRTLRGSSAQKILEPTSLVDSQKIK